MAATVYYRQGLIGTDPTDLSQTDGTVLLDGDPAFVFDGTDFYCYRLNATSGATESSPDIIEPDTNPGNKRWILQAVQNVTPPQQVVTGTLSMYGGTTAPTGYLLCDGDAVSRTTYSDLFTAIGESFGVGDGSSTFNLPDMRGRTPIGLDNLGGVSANRVTSTEADSIGGSSGAETHTLTVAQMPSHRHSLGVAPDTDSAASTSGPADFPWSSNWNTGYAGSSGSHNNMQPYIALNYIIKT